MKPAVNRILVEPIKAPPATIAGVEMDTKDPQVRGVILAVGAGQAIDRMGLKEGMIAVFGAFSGEDVTLDGKELKVLFVDESIESELLGYDNNRK